MHPGPIPGYKKAEASNQEASAKWRRRESLRGAKVQQAGALTPRTDERRKAQRAPLGALKQRWRRRESNPGPQGVRSTIVHVRSRHIPDN